MNIVKYLNSKISFYKILMVFWGLFWLLNGLDKFYNGDFIPNPNSYATSSIIYNLDGKEVYKIQPVEPYGWFGVNRDSKMVGYFKRLNLPKWMALTALYAMGFIEMVGERLEGFGVVYVGYSTHCGEFSCTHHHICQRFNTSSFTELTGKKFQVAMS